MVLMMYLWSGYDLYQQDQQAIGAGKPTADARIVADVRYL